VPSSFLIDALDIPKYFYYFLIGIGSLLPFLWFVLLPGLKLSGNATIRVLNRRPHLPNAQRIHYFYKYLIHPNKNEQSIPYQGREINAI
jgi:hypothetical protein